LFVDVDDVLVDSPPQATNNSTDDTATDKRDSENKGVAVTRDNVTLDNATAE
jgi:hypothetical protein